MATEDQRQAASLATGVSNQIMAASLAMMTILGALLVFIMDKRSLTLSGTVVLILSFVAFVMSVGVGAKGVAAIYKNGAGGTWNYLNGDTHFQIQAFTAIGGVLFFTLGLVLMGPPNAELELRAVTQSLDSLRQRSVHNDSAIAQLLRATDSLSLQVNRAALRTRDSLDVVRDTTDTALNPK